MTTPAQFSSVLPPLFSFAPNASGEVFAFTANASSGSIWNTVEKPILEGKAGIRINYMAKHPSG